MAHICTGVIVPLSRLHVLKFHCPTFKTKEHCRYYSYLIELVFLHEAHATLCFDHLTSILCIILGYLPYFQGISP